MPLESTLAISPAFHSAAVRINGERRHPTRLFTGYLCIPNAAIANGAAVVVVQEIYGVNKEVRRYSDWLASQGYMVLAPNLLWEHGDHLDFDYPDRLDALALVRSMGFETVADDIASAYLSLARMAGPGNKVGVVALGWGGKPALLARRAIPGSTQVLYYPGGLEGEDEWLASSRGPTQFHLGEDDGRTPTAFRQNLSEIYRGVPDSEIHVYKGAGHGFANLDRKEYFAEAGALADQRTLDYLARQLLRD